MSAGTITKKGEVADPIVASFCPGTYVYCVTKGGRIDRVKLSDATVAVTVDHISGDCKCLYTDGTSLYLGMADGRLIKVTISTGADSELARFNCAITAISVSTHIYVSLINGDIYEYALS